ncbi:hypothetical protein [Winogradskya humida]|nr:hypothetical protein [Actinoplanes humidus]
MSFEARVLQILIASPGDVQTERQILTEVMHEWNAINSRDRRLVLLPLRWEMDTAPEMNASPQVSINRQIVDQCDMAIGVFWTRLGTPTASAVSGTAEEIGRVGDAGKPVMLYFSRAKADLDSLDLAEYSRLKEFKDRTYPEGLNESYESIAEFRTKISRQLAIKIMEVIARGVDDAHAVAEEKPQPLIISLGIGDPPAPTPSPVLLTLEHVICLDEDSIPEYVEEGERGGRSMSTSSADISVNRVGAAEILGIGGVGRSNPNYIREVVEYFKWKKSRQVFRLAVTNISEEGVRDVYIEMRPVSEYESIHVGPREYRPAPEKRSSGIFVGDNIFTMTSARDVQGFIRSEKGDDGGSASRLELEIPAVQPQRTVYSSNELEIKSSLDTEMVLVAKIYSNSGMPAETQLKLTVQVVQRKITYREILREFEDE